MFSLTAANAIALYLFIVFQVIFAPSNALPNLQRRGLPGAVYTCTGENFSGDCGWSLPTTNCRIATAKSIGPDPGGYCTLYKKFDCTMSVRTLRFPGVSTGLPDYMSFRCGMGIGISGTVGPQANANPDLSLKALPADRLAGGVGSTERKKHLQELQAMEKDGFKEGMIGLRKDMYY
ncbi:uncharacterized protein M421DRAFT_415321 [Didymella exigua CBS 183.55]|uniref:Uncharacterized protein n=1 Tax=Didymella exigua CBS 183.55 TaxID=1150837 RepID=A0A6A5S4A6_9PLEO|nr:uncharacterized protein M421DRAFT_415321 [Didymella exigua CBS 183.55]KAF1934284.1 hypothetical protein M421DRAFT_415321 [Didymella exigua CBS 183.55]